MLTALDPVQVVQQLRAVSREHPLAVRLIEAVEALDTYHGRIVTFVEQVDTSGTPAPESAAAGEPGTRRVDRDDLKSAARMDVIAQAVTELFQPDQERLRLPAAILADAFLGLYSGRKRTQHSALPAEQLVDLFMHGALTSTNPA
jgi:hypothetical protein